MTATATACVSPGNGGGGREALSGSSLFTFPLLVLIMSLPERRGLGLLRGLWPRPRRLPFCPGQRRCYPGPHGLLPGDPAPAASTGGHARTQSRSCPSATWAASSPRAAGPLGSTPTGQALGAQRGSSPSLDAFESRGQRGNGAGRRSQRSLGWMDRPQQWGLGTVQGEGMSWLLDVVLSCFLSPPACLCDVSLQESLMFSDPEYSRGRRLGRRRVSSSFFPTFFYKMWQLGLL